MDQANPGNNPDAPADVPVKRKRGRPRKYPSTNQGVPRDDQNLNHAENSSSAKVPKLNHGGNARAPPGFEGINGNQPRPVEPSGDGVDPMVGQVVSGVIEASFDAGYLINVRVGNSETSLRGVVFKPGHYVPISAENDVAPNARMIMRNEMPLPTENYTRAHGSHRNGTAHTFSDSTATNQVSRVAPRATNLVSSKGKQIPSVVNPAISRGNVVPVVLQPIDQPIDLSNGLPPANQPSPVLSQTALHATSKGKQVPIVAPQAPHASNGTMFVTEATHPEVPKVMQNENGAGNGPAQLSHDAEGKSLDLHGMPMEKLLAEVIKRGQGHSQSAGSSMDLPLSIEPLQAVQPHQPDPPAATRPLEKEGIGRMTQLLQVVQEKMTENQAPRAEELATSPRPNLDELRRPEEARNDDAVH